MTKDIALDENYQVCINNDLVKSKSTLSLNATKLLRIAIMQIMKEDPDLLTYRVSITKLAEFLNIPSSNLYRDVHSICIELLQQIVEIGDGNIHHKWKAFQWCSKCSYEDGTGIITIRLHEELRPYLLELSKNYTSYLVDNIIRMKSVYAIRVYELIKCRLKTNRTLSKPVRIELSLDEIRKATDTENKFTKTNNFKQRIIDVAVKEINENAQFSIAEYGYIKDGRAAVGVYFIAQAKTYHVLPTEKEAQLLELLQRKEA